MILGEAEGRTEEAVDCLHLQLGGSGREQQPSWVRKMLSLQTGESRQGPVQTQLTIAQCLIYTGPHCAVFELIRKEQTQLLHAFCKPPSVPTFTFTSLQCDF